MDSPFHNALIPAHAAHYLFNGTPEERVATIMKCLHTYHGIHYISKQDVEAHKYKEWKKQNGDLHKSLIELDLRLKDLRQKPEEEGDPVEPAVRALDIPEYVNSSVYMEIGIAQELEALNLFEREICEKMKEKTKEGDKYVVVSDQSRRECKIGENITVIGKIDGMLALDSNGKRTYKAVVEVKTRMNGFRENPADLTQLTLYSRMIPNASKQLYILVQYDPYKKEIKQTTYSYTQVEEHWNNVVLPGLKGVYQALCAKWKDYTDETSPTYVGLVYRKRMSALIDKFLTILNVPDMQGDPALIALLQESKDMLNLPHNLKPSYTAFAGCVTPEILVRVERRELAFFEENLKSFLRLEPKQKGIVAGYVDKYSKYIAGIVRDNVTDKTRDTLWKLVDELLASL